MNQTETWFKQRNLDKEMPPEAVTYLLVLLAVHPQRLPVPVTTLMAKSFLQKEALA